MKNSSRFYSQKTYNRIATKIKLLSSKKSYKPYSFLNLQLGTSLISFVLCLIIFYHHLYLAFIIPPLIYIGIEYFLLDAPLNKRKNLLNREALFYFQILSLTLESGNNLKNAIEITSSNIDNELSREFKKAIDDVNMGSSLTESLNNLKLRIPSDTINNIILNLTEANIYGNNMIESLNNELEYLNDKLLLNVKEKINKMPIEISVVSVLIFIPLILLIILSPLIIELLTA